MQHQFAYPKVTALQKERPTSPPPPAAARPPEVTRPEARRIALADDVARAQHEEVT
jgi:hypothetical protein